MFPRDAPDSVHREVPRLCTFSRCRREVRAGYPDGCGECCGGATARSGARARLPASFSCRVSRGDSAPGLSFRRPPRPRPRLPGVHLGDRLLGCRRSTAAALGPIGLPLGRPPCASTSSSDGSSPPSGTTSSPCRRHVLEDLDRDRVAADPLDRLGQVDLPPVDADLLLLPELVDDVRRGDRAEETAARAGLDVEAKHGRAELLRDLLGLVGVARLVAGTLLLALLELREERRRRGLRKPPRLRGSSACTPRATFTTSPRRPTCSTS